MVVSQLDCGEESNSYRHENRVKSIKGKSSVNSITITILINRKMKRVAKSLVRPPFEIDRKKTHSHMPTLMLFSIWLYQEENERRAKLTNFPVCQAT